MHKKKTTGVKILIFIFVVILIWVFFLSKYNLLKVIKSKITLEQKNQKIIELEKEKEKLESERKQLAEENPDVMEKKAREIGMVKDGEIIIRIRDEDSEESENKKDRIEKNE